MKTTILLLLLILASASAFGAEETSFEKKELQRELADSDNRNIPSDQEFPPLAYTINNIPIKKQTTYDFVYGATQLSALFLSAILLLISFISLAKTLETKNLSSWNFLALMAVLFFIQQVFTTLSSFGIYTTNISQFIPSIMIGLLIAGIMRQKAILKGCYK